jgi:hypothetical protein
LGACAGLNTVEGEGDWYIGCAVVDGCLEDVRVCGIVLTGNVVERSEAAVGCRGKGIGYGVVGEELEFFLVSPDI